MPAHSRPAAPSRRPGPPCATERETAPLKPAIQSPRGYQPTGRGQVHPIACRFEKPRIKWFRSLARAVDERKRSHGVLSRISRPRSAGFCIANSDWIFEHSISGSGNLSLNPGIPAWQQQIARPRSVGKCFLSYNLLLGGRIWSCMHALMRCILGRYFISFLSGPYFAFFSVFG